MSGECDEPGGGVVHKGHTPTFQTWQEAQGTSVITWRVHRCACGQHTLDIFEEAHEK